MGVVAPHNPSENDSGDSLLLPLLPVNNHNFAIMKPFLIPLIGLNFLESVRNAMEYIVQKFTTYCIPNTELRG